MNSKHFKFLYSSIFFIFIGICFSAFSNRPLLGEGSTWFMRLISEHRIFYDDAFYRYTDRILHVPSLLLVSIWPSFDSLAIFLLSFMYSLHPLVSLFITLRLLRKKNRLDLFVFPVLSLVLATLPVLPNSIVMAALALSVFWPLFFLILLHKRGDKLESFFIFILFLAQLFSYEPAILFFILFGSICFYDLAKNNLNSRLFNYTVILTSSISVLWLLYIIVSPQRQHATGPFILSIQSYRDPFRIYCLFNIFIVSFFLFGSQSKKYYSKNFFLTIWTVFFINSGYFIYKMFRIFDFLTYSYPSRTTAIPFAFVLAVICAFMSVVKVNHSWINSKAGKNLLVLTSIIVYLGTIYDLQVTYRWNKNFQYFSNLVLDKKGCVNLSKIYNDDFTPSTIPPYAIAASSILVQILNKVKPIKSILFLEDENNPKNACEDFSSGEFIASQGSRIAIKNSFLTFSEEIFNFQIIEK
jgi:hypothetical protein